jgi:PAS domain-containing protein
MREYSISHFDFPGSDGLPGEAAPKNVSDGAASPLRDPDTPSQVGMRSRFYQHALDEAAVVAVTDRKGTIVSVNRKFCDLSGYSREELIGQNHRVLKSGRHDRAFFHELYHDQPGRRLAWRNLQPGQERRALLG